METGLHLVTPTLEHKEKALRFRQAFFDAGERTIDGSEMLDRMETYEEWLGYVTAIAAEKTLPAGSVLTDTFFLMDAGEQIVGIIDLRHSLNDFFRDFGHSGYSVLPSARRQGHATWMLGEILKKAKAAGLEKVQLSALRTNAPSVKTIVNNGGVYTRSFSFYGMDADVYIISLV